MPPVSAVGRLPLATVEACDPGRHIDARLLTFHARTADQAHAASTPGTAWPVIGTPARLITGEQPDPPLSTTSITLTTLQQRTPHRSPGRALSGTSSWSPPDASSAPSPCRSPRRSSANAAQAGLTPPPEGRRRRANKPPSLAQHRLYEDRLHQSSFSVRDTRPLHKGGRIRPGW